MFSKLFFYLITLLIIVPCNFGLHYNSGACSARDISVAQGVVSYHGIPQYLVNIVNTCISGCAPSDIHFHCGWFASAKMVNPQLFKRLAYNDCLLNDGKPFNSSQVIQFTYLNTFKYPIAFKSAKFC